MTRGELTAFFREVTGSLGLSPTGYRRTRGSVERRLRRRLRELGLRDLDGYRSHLIAHPEEWGWLDGCCRITISRFWRDAVVFDRVATELLPERARAATKSGRRLVEMWSAGCASGEEAYSLALAARVSLEPTFPELSFEVLATDSDPTVLRRAVRALYPAAALRELPGALRQRAFEERGEEYWLRRDWRAGVRFELADLRRVLPEKVFDLICCRNLAFTYFDEALRRRLCRAFAERLRPGGALVLGMRETLPEVPAGLSPRQECVYVRAVDSP